MIKNIGKITLMLLPALLAAIIISCNNDEAITYSGSDVTERISSLSSTEPGQGAPLTITGSQMDRVERVFVGELVVTKHNFVSQDESSITFKVPANSALGENELMVVWSGFDTGVKTVNVVEFHTITQFGPLAAAEGQVVTIWGNNLHLVEDVEANGVSASIVEQTSGVLKFTMPAGATTGTIAISSAAGIEESVEDLIACDSDPDDYGCLPVVNTNGSFEDGDVGVDAVVPGWSLGGSLTTSEITDEDAYEGNQSAKITINSLGANPWNIQPNSSMPVDPTATYHVSLWVKGSGIATIKFPIDGGGSPNYDELGGTATMALSTEEWTEIAYDIQPASEAAGDQSVRLAISMSYAGNVGGVLYMDNLRVVKID